MRMLPGTEFNKNHSLPPKDKYFVFHVDSLCLDISSITYSNQHIRDSREVWIDIPKYQKDHILPHVGLFARIICTTLVPI